MHWNIPLNCEIGEDTQVEKQLNREDLLASEEICVYRTGRFLVAELRQPHRVLSSSAKNGGQQDNLRYLVNHQSCEGTDHRERYEYITGLGLEAYHDVVCHELGLRPDSVALMGTAANMNYAAVAQKHDASLAVTAIVTAGVQGNATCAGDPAEFRETANGWEKILPYSGTINTMLFINHPLTDGALARAVVTMTEAKSAALHRLAVSSLYSQDTATGTGTDQYCITSLHSEAPALTSTSPHVKLGELIGLAVRDATLEALRWQNGLEPSYTRGVFHALGRYGLNQHSFFADIAPRLTERERELLQRNSQSVFYEPLVSASAYAMAAVLDRVRYTTLPASVAREALRQQAATLAASLAAKPERWSEFHAQFLDADPERPAALALAAIALGWSAKWQ